MRFFSLMWFRCGQISVSVDDGDSSSVCHLPNLCNWHHFAAKLVTLRSRLDGPGRYLEVSKKKKQGYPQSSSVWDSPEIIQLWGCLHDYGNPHLDGELLRQLFGARFMGPWWRCVVGDDDFSGGTNNGLRKITSGSTDRLDITSVHTTSCFW